MVFSDGHHDHRRLVLCSSVEREDGLWPQTLAGVEFGDELLHPLRIQVSRVLRQQHCHLVLCRWVDAIALAAAHRFARRDFLFHLPKRFVCDRRLSARDARTTLAARLCFVRLFLSATRGRSHRACRESASAGCSPRVITESGLRSGLILFLWGLFEKLVISDNAALLANKVFSIQDASFPLLWGGVIAFGVQIYADFSGYTDMARGVARVFGFEFRLNFNNPYLAQSPAEFWRRWHMSLSTWFRDYVYIPLGGSRKGPARMRWNLLVTFLLSGLWHGASWNFILWGAFHGLLVACWPFGSSGGRWMRSAVRVVVTWCLMHVGWLLFRERTSLTMLVHYFTLNPLAASAADWRIGIAFALESLIYGLPLLVVLPVVQRFGWLRAKDDVRGNSWPWILCQAALVAVLVFGIAALRCPVTSDFIYFQF